MPKREEGAKKKRGVSEEVKDVVLDTMYISNAYVGTNGGSALANYIGIGGSVATGDLGPDVVVKEVTINAATAADNKVKVWKKGGAYKVPEDEKTTDDVVWSGMTYVVHSGRTDDTDWKVEIIAGNVPKMKSDKTEETDTASQDNAMSLITLCTVGGKKALLTGDATFSTEKFLRVTQNALIADVDLLHVPHHGSFKASGTLFVNAVNPRAAVVSVNHMEHKHRMPRETVMTRWKNKTSDGAADHFVDTWQEVPRDDAINLYKDWETNKTYGTDYSYNESKTFW